jgi:hypothetical protein
VNDLRLPNLKRAVGMQAQLEGVLSSFLRADGCPPTLLAPPFPIAVLPMNGRPAVYKWNQYAFLTLGDARSSRVYEVNMRCLGVSVMFDSVNLDKS